MAHANIFPDFAVKQLFHEYHVEREDDLVLALVQNDLLVRCINDVLKGALVSAMHSKHKYISQKDIAYGAQTSTLPFAEGHADGFLLDTRKFGNYCAEHVLMLTQMLSRSGVETLDVKLSSEMLLTLQECVEGFVRGLMAHVVCKSGRPRIGYRHMDACLGEFFGGGDVDGTFVPWLKTS